MSSRCRLRSLCRCLRAGVLLTALLEGPPFAIEPTHRTKRANPNNTVFQGEGLCAVGGRQRFTANTPDFSRPAPISATVGKLRRVESMGKDRESSPPMGDRTTGDPPADRDAIRATLPP